jgi:hypothetical protein
MQIEIQVVVPMIVLVKHEPLKVTKNGSVLNDNFAV